VLETCRWCAAPLLGAIQPTSGGPGLVSAGFGSSLGGVAPALDPRQRSKERLDEGRAGVKLLRAGLQPASSVRPSSQPCHRANPRTTPLCRAPKNATARRALRLTVRLGSSPQRDHDGSSSRHTCSGEDGASRYRLDAPSSERSAPRLRSEELRRSSSPSPSGSARASGGSQIASASRIFPGLAPHGAVSLSRDTACRPTTSSSPFPD
jgi:hypothetical protein